VARGGGGDGGGLLRDDRLFVRFSKFVRSTAARTTHSTAAAVPCRTSTIYLHNDLDHVVGRETQVITGWLRQQSVCWCFFHPTFGGTCETVTESHGLISNGVWAIDSEEKHLKPPTVFCQEITGEEASEQNTPCSKQWQAPQKVLFTAGATDRKVDWRHQQSIGISKD